MSSAELVLALNHSSCGACELLGPPPSAILSLPPPPMPAFLKPVAINDTPDDGGLGATPCEQACDWNGGAPGVEYVELPRQVGGVGAVDDTWFLVLVSCCAGVLLLGAVLAIVLMRCRQGRGSKCVLSLDPSSLDGGKSSKSSKLVGGEVLYPDPRALWAALTPSGGTQHFVGTVPGLGGLGGLNGLGGMPMPPPPVPHLQLTQRHLTAPSPPPAPPQPSPPAAEPEYAMPLSAGPPPLEPPPPPPVRVAAFPPQPHQQPHHAQPRHHSKHSHTRQHGHINKMATLSHATYAAADTSSFDNSGFVDSDDQLLAGDAYSPLGYYHTVGGSRRGLGLGLGVLRPKVSSPTRIANPNLPPLNLHPTASATGPASASSTASRRSLRKAARHSDRHLDRHGDRHGERHGDRHGDRYGERHGDRRGSETHASNGTLAL